MLTKFTICSSLLFLKTLQKFTLWIWFRVFEIIPKSQFLIYFLTIYFKCIKEDFFGKTLMFSIISWSIFKASFDLLQLESGEWRGLESHIQIYNFLFETWIWRHSTHWERIPEVHWYQAWKFVSEQLMSLKIISSRRKPASSTRIFYVICSFLKLNIIIR